MFSQSNAVARYLGRKYGLAGDNIYEELEIDQNVDYFTELRTSIAFVNYLTLKLRLTCKGQKSLKLLKK